MRERGHKSNIENIMPIMVDAEQLAILLNVGVNSAVKIAEAAQARVDIPNQKLARYATQKIMDYINKNCW